MSSAYPVTRSNLPRVATPPRPVVWPPSPEAVRRARAGDSETLTVILAAAYPRVVGFFRGAGMQRPEAEDRAADVCEAVVRNLAGLREPVAFEAWFWKIARARLHHWIRIARRERRPPPVDLPPVQPDEAYTTTEEHAWVRAALVKLSSRDRELLWLREVEGLSYDELGSRLGAAVGSMRVACHRARKRLEAAYRELEAPPHL